MKGVLVVTASFTNGNSANYFVHVCPDITRLLFRDGLSYRLANNAMPFDIRGYLDVETAEAFERYFEVSSDNPDVLKVLYGTTLQPSGNGTANITVTSADHPELSVTHEFTVTDPQVPTEIIALSEDNQTVYADHYHANLLQISYTDGAAITDTEWTSDRPDPATVTGNGLFAGIEAKETGTALITATSKSNPELSVSFHVNVVDDLQPQGSYETTAGISKVFYSEPFSDPLQVVYGEDVTMMITNVRNSIYPALKSYYGHRVAKSEFLKATEARMAGAVGGPDGMFSISSIVTFHADKPGVEQTRIGTYSFNTRVLFTDAADENAYFFEPVYLALENNITVGACGAGKFSPNNPCTREQIVTFLWRLAGEPEPQSSSNFSDVKPDAWYYKPVTWASENKITVGLNDGTGRLGVGQKCSRAMIVTFLYRYRHVDAGK